MDSSEHSNLLMAIQSLRQERSAIQEQIAGLQARLETILEALSPLEKLTGQPKQQGTQESRPVTGVFSVPPTSYRKMKLPEAISVYLSACPGPISAPNIARHLLSNGFETTSDNFPNIVGMTLRRLEGQRFKRMDGKWTNLRR